MSELKAEIERETRNIVVQAEYELKSARDRFDQVSNEFDAAKHRLARAEVQMAAALAIQGAAKTHIVLQDLKEGNLEN